MDYIGVEQALGIEAKKNFCRCNRAMYPQLGGYA